MRRSRGSIALVLAALATGAPAVGCARTAEERQLDDMRGEIDRIQEDRDRADRETLAPEAADSRGATVPPPSPSLPPPPRVPADQDAVTLNGASGPSGDSADDYADTEDTAPRPVLRISGSGSARGRSWHDDQVEASGAADDTAQAPGPGRLDPAAAPAYDAAMALVTAKQYEKAIDAFAAFLVHWPDHPYADNAMYWRGECYFARGDYRHALEQFEGVLARFPAGNKAPDALLKLGMSELKLGDPVRAKDSFDRLTQLYPQSDAARRIPPVTVPAATPRGPAAEDTR
jgi:tol-pal system protein YbgF